MARWMTVLACAGFVQLPAGMAVAEESAAPDLSEWSCRFCPFKSGMGGVLEPRTGYLSGDPFRFGDYTGLDQEDPLFVGDADVRYRGEGGLDWDLSARDAGLDSTSAKLRAGWQGRFGFELGYRGIPKRRSATAATPFIWAGGDNLTLPGGWTPASTTSGMTDLETSLRNRDLQLDRRRFDLGAVFHPTSRVDYRVRYRRDERTGTEAMGAAFLTQAALLPEPVDDVTEQIEASAALALPDWQLHTAYHGSFYRNDHDVLAWQNPYDPLAPGADQGRLALAPDNQAHQVSTALAVQPLPRTHLSGQIAFGRMTQDDPLVPATVNPNLAEPLPRADADGRVDTVNGTVRAGTAVAGLLRLNLEFTYRDRDNRTPPLLYPQVATDVFTAPERSNRPYRFTDQVWRLSGRQRLADGVRLGAGLDVATRHRSLQAVERTRENTAWGEVKLQPAERMDLEIRFEDARRDGPTPRALDAVEAPQNPRHRTFNLADRDRTRTALRWSRMSTERLTYGVRVEHARDRYSDTAVGLTEGTELHVSADGSFLPAPDLVLTAFAGFTRLEAVQAGSQGFGVVDWSAEQRDRTGTLLFGVERRNLLGRLDLAASASWVKSVGDVDVTSGTPATFPDLTSTLRGVGVRATWRVQQRVSIRGGFRHERFTSDDWQLDSVAADTIPNVVAMDLQTPAYRVNLFYLSLLWKL